MNWSSYTKMIVGDGTPPTIQRKSEGNRVVVTLRTSAGEASAKATYFGKDYLTLRSALARSREGE